MKKLKNMLVVGALLAAAALAGCGSKDPGTPPEVLLDGTQVVVGQTRPSDLEAEKWELDDLGKMIFELPDRSWTSSIFLGKEGTNYAMLVLVNDSKEAKPAKDCVIEELGFYALDDANQDLNISINGVNPIGKTQEELKELFPDLEMDEDDGDYLFHYLKSGDYTVRFEYSKGVLSDVDVMHKFDKSYQTK
ncbi:hypothetical protein F220043C3_25770 [Enterocloster asparagiformis]|uniref:hypothetical protein n=2 Tax=Enterocloster asparagiformis TaxID=333367 RepID=UPI0034B1FFBA